MKPTQKQLSELSALRVRHWGLQVEWHFYAIDEPHVAVKNDVPSIMFHSLNNYGGIKGNGLIVMKQVIALCDQMGVRIVLWCVPSLSSYYEKLGFTGIYETLGRNHVSYFERLPQTAAAVKHGIYVSAIPTKYCGVETFSPRLAVWDTGANIGSEVIASYSFTTHDAVDRGVEIAQSYGTLEVFKDA